ncbi:MAG: metallophosphoesterase family protein [Thermomicrobiales bacterium]
MPIRVLAVSDQVDPRIYSASLKERMSDVQLVLGCGDLPASYLEFLADALDRPIYFVFGNHLEEATRQSGGKLYQPMGCIDVGGKVIHDSWTGLIVAGIPGSPKYGEGEPLQFTEFQIRWMIWRMAPRLMWNRMRHGRAVDILVTHAPPRDLGDRDDLPHRGFVALRRMLKRFHPKYLLHGHIHLYDRSEPWEFQYEGTSIINVYPYRVLDLDLATLRHDLPAPEPVPSDPMAGADAQQPGPPRTEEHAHG